MQMQNVRINKNFKKKPCNTKYQHLGATLCNPTDANSKCQILQKSQNISMNYKISEFRGHPV
jgi:hypothetical protein